MGSMARALLPCAALLAASLASAADWRVLATDAGNNRYRVDRESIDWQGPIVRAILRTDYAAPRRVDAVDGKVRGAVDHLVVDCDSGQFALESRAFVLSDGSVSEPVVTGPDDLEYRVPTPGSVSETLVNFLCRESSAAR